MPRRILYVEDDEFYQFLVKKFLQEHRDGHGNQIYEVEIAGDMESYSEKMKLYADDPHNHYRPNLVLMDIILPKKEGGLLIRDGGLQLAKSNLHGEIPIIFITIYSSPFVQNEVKEYQDGHRKIIGKPINPSELLEAIELAIRGKP